MRWDDDLGELRAGAWVRRTVFAADGEPFVRWEKDMPRIHPMYLDTVVYLYASEADAKAAAHFGGSGLLVSIASVYGNGLFHYYIVTNQHVAAHARAVRLNTSNGKTKVLPITAEQWIDHPSGDDVSACSIDLYGNALKFKSIDASKGESALILTKPQMETLALGVGDDVFLVGRYVDHAGIQQNTPSGRFGRISQMPGEPIWQTERSYNQESFVVDIPSIGGYSGSPVFLYPTKDRLGVPIPQPYLLGINWGHLSAPAENVYVFKQESGGPATPIRVDGLYVFPHAGLAGVVPAWKIYDILDDADLVEQRAREDNAHFNKTTGSIGGVLDDS